MKRFVFSTPHIAFWLGFALTILGALSYFLLSSLMATLLGLLASDPRRPGLVFILVGLVLSMTSLGWLRKNRSPQPAIKWKVSGCAISLILAGLYIAGAFITIPYRLEEVWFRNGEVELAGTLFLPKVDGPHPAILLLRGSGSVFDESRWGSYAIADHLARMGIASLAYDNRGFGGSNGPSARDEAFSELAADALAGLEYLRSRPEIDPEQVGLWGISASGWTAPIAASSSDHIAFLIIVSGGGVRPADEFVFDVQIALEDADFSQSEIAQALPQIIALREQINDYYRTGEGYDEITLALLKYEPTVETRNRFRMRPNDVAEWELRIGKYRVFYNVEDEVQIVSIEVVGFKSGNQLFVRGKRRDL